MLGLDLPDPPLLADSDLPLAHDQPATPPTPPGPSHHFPEPEDTTRQTCRKNVTDMGACLGPRVLCSVVATSTTSAATIDATTMESSSSTVPTVFNLKPFKYVMVLYVCRKCNKRWKWKRVCCLCIVYFVCWGYYTCRKN